MTDKPAGVDEQKVITKQPAAVTEDEQQQQQAVSDFNKGKDAAHAGMKVRVHSPFRDYYDGFAFSLTAENATGPFDILPHHHNFISLLTACELIIRTVKEGEQKIRISGGIIHVKADQVVVFLDV
jgi:hypothetical protein